MRLKLHLDNQNGDTVIYPVYDIDFATVIATTGYHLNNHTVYASSGVENYVGSSFYVANDNGAINRCFFNKPPTRVEDNNTKCIFPYSFRYDDELGGVWYPHGWFNSDIFEAYTEQTQPSDWNSNTGYKYARFLADVTGYKAYTPHIPNSDTFVSGEVAIDLKRYMCRKLYTDEGAYFVVCQGSSYGSGNIYPISYGLFDFLQTPASAAQGDAYFHNKDNRAYQQSVVRGGNSWEQTSQDIIRNGKPCVPIFVRYTIGVDECYGVCLIEYASSNSDVIVRIDVVGVSTNSWGTSIISGGESGQGTWGNISIPTISNGTFSERSDNVSRDATDINSSTSIVNGINNRIKGLYSINAYTIYRLTVLDIANSQVPNIIKILFSENFWTNWSNKLYNPISTILSFGYIPSEFVPYQSEMPVKRLTLGGYDVSQHIRDETPGVVAVPEFNTQRPVSMHQFPEIDLQKYFDGYADFEPFTKCILHLPFIGNVKLDTNKIAHGKLGVEYICDVATGNVIANIWTSDYDGKSQYTASASGNCLYSLPLFASAQDGSSIGKIAQGVGLMVGGIATQMPGTAISGAVTAGSGALDLATSLWNREISSTGTLGGNNSLISPKQVWLEIIRPIWIENMHYQLLNGIPAEMSNCIADCGQVDDLGVPYDGFLVITEIELDNVNCTDSERSEIAELLAAGIYIRGGELLE